MKKIPLLATALLFLSLSCTKNYTTPAPPSNPNPIIGSWVGSYVSSASSAVHGPHYLRLDILSDSVVFTSGQGEGDNGVTSYARGKWTLKGTAFTVIDTAIDAAGTNTQSYTASYDSTAGTLNGTYNDTNGVTDTGPITLNREP